MSRNAHRTTKNQVARDAARCVCARSVHPDVR
jgi:hypothetical protein